MAQDWSQWVGLTTQFGNDMTLGRAPTIDDDENSGPCFGSGSTVSDGTSVWLCMDGAPGAAVWVKITP